MPFLKFRYQPKNELEEGGRSAEPVLQEESEPEQTCPNCHKSIPISTLRANMNVCSCGHHFRMSARQRIALTADEGSFCELDGSLRSSDPLLFSGYQEKLRNSEQSTGENEGVVCGECRIDGNPCCLFVMEPGFMMGSMGSVVGEKITRLFEHALERRLPVIGCTVSGGARMQEGLLSLMQMAKTSAAVKRHSDAGLLYIVLLTDPTTGGVTASFAMEGDIILAEPNAMVGFAGARVIEQTTRKHLPKGFQRAEFLLEHGFVDAIVPRSEQREALSLLLSIHSDGGAI